MASPFDPERWLNERQQRQQDILRSLRQWQAGRSDAATVQAGLRRLGAAVLKSPRPDYQAHADALLSTNCSLVAGLHNSSTAAQRQHAVAKFKGWEDDLLGDVDARSPANCGLLLSEAQANYRLYGASSLNRKKHCRLPNENEPLDAIWKPLPNMK